jgi:hypothetical protein
VFRAREAKVRFGASWYFVRGGDEFLNLFAWGRWWRTIDAAGGRVALQGMFESSVTNRSWAWMAGAWKLLDSGAK